MRRLILAFSLFATPALAAPPATIDMTAPILDQHGKPAPDTSQVTPDDPKCEKCGPLTLGTVVSTALLTDRGRDEPNLSSIEKARRGVLALRVLDNNAAALNAKELADVVRLVAIWPPLICARAVPMLDPNQDIEPGK